MLGLSFLARFSGSVRVLVRGCGCWARAYTYFPQAHKYAVTSASVSFLYGRGASDVPFFALKALCAASVRVRGWVRALAKSANGENWCVPRPLWGAAKAKAQQPRTAIAKRIVFRLPACLVRVCAV